MIEDKEVTRMAKDLDADERTMTRCLEEAKECWKETFFVDGLGREFDKYEIPLEPVAIAMIAVALFNKNP